MPREPKSVPGIKPAGPYSPAVIVSGRLLFCSSQGPTDYATGKHVEGTIHKETRQANDKITNSSVSWTTCSQHHKNFVKR